MMEVQSRVRQTLTSLIWAFSERGCCPLACCTLGKVRQGTVSRTVGCFINENYASFELPSYSNSALVYRLASAAFMNYS